MSLFLVSLELFDPAASLGSCDNVANRLSVYLESHKRIAGNMWLVRTDENYKAVLQKIADVIDKDDRAFVCGVVEGKSAYVNLFNGSKRWLNETV